jgi:periplasmic protein TonB
MDKGNRRRGKRFAPPQLEPVMSVDLCLLPDVYTPREIARAACVPASAVRALIEAGQVTTVDGRFVAAVEAVRTVRILRGESAGVAVKRGLFEAAPPARRRPGFSLAASGALHAAIVAVMALATTLGLRGDVTEIRTDSTPVRLVFLTTPGPGGGGGGGGMRQPAPPARALKEGRSALRSPVPVHRAVRVARPEPARPVQPPPSKPVERPAEPPPPVQKADPVPPVVAPVVSAPADAADRAGVLIDSAPPAPSQGSGANGGAGTGSGSGMGEGDGAGIGPGRGGGTGGGPYRPGSGVTPPSLLREIKPDYTEEARRRGIKGDVVLEIVVRSDGTVGSVKLLSGLGGGLEQRAIDAVRQWRFAPARRHGVPVDVMVEVAVEFRLR